MLTANEGHSRAAARRSLLFFLVSLAGLSGAILWSFFTDYKPLVQRPGLMLLFMFAPAIASLITRLVFKEGLHDAGLRLNARAVRYTCLAWALPALIGLISYTPAWLLGFATFKAPIPSTDWLYVPDTAGNFAIAFAWMFTVGTLVNSFPAFGEELGWRGYLLNRLIGAGWPAPLLTSGFIWGLWHLPLLVTGHYIQGVSWGTPVLLTGFMVLAVAVGYVLAALRLASDSLWPAVLAHASWNSLVLGTFERATTAPPGMLGETGYLTIAATVIVGLSVRQKLLPPRAHQFAW